MKCKRKVYIVSGPLGVGKSTVAKELGRLLEECVLVEGDNFFVSLENLKKLDWDTRVRMAWENVVCQTRICLKRGFNVVIDFVVEEELEWFGQEIQDLSVELYYVVLVANKDTIKERLKYRGDLKYLERSLVLLQELTEKQENSRFLYETGKKEVSLIARDIVSSERFLVG